MVHVLLLFFLIGITSAFYPPTIHSDTNSIQENAGLGKFIELNEHDVLTLRCFGRHDELEFVYPDLDDHKGFSQSDFDSRLEEVSVDYNEIEIKISDLKESDTGPYSCNAKDQTSLNDTVYVFVHGSTIFVPLKSDGFMFSPGEVVIPCKATKFFEKSEIELYGNGELIKDARKNYNHMTGFKVTKKMYESKPISQVPFVCKYLGNPPLSTSYLITEREKITSNDYNLYWEEIMEWPYIGINYTLTCYLAYNGTGQFPHYVNTLHVTCPQCSSDDDHATAERGRLKGNSIHANIIVDTLTVEDSGDYSCRWKQEGRDEDVIITKMVDVAPKRGQIKVIERSPELLRIKEGEAISLFAKLSVYPMETDEYSAKWIRKYSTPIKNELQSESLINDDQHTITNELKDLKFIEKLLIARDTTTDLSGTYVLSVIHSGTVENIEWQVAIENTDIETEISIRESSSFVVFDQPFYPPNTQLHIDCIAVSIPPAKVQIEQKSARDPSAEFGKIDEEQLLSVSGTYESGFIWNVTAVEDIEVKCTADRGGKTQTATKVIRIAESEPTVTRRIYKNEKATSLENPKEIYEGDGIELNCIVPHDKKWTVGWFFNNKAMPSAEAEIGHSKHVVTQVWNVAASNAGEYACIVEKDDLKKRLVQNILIETVSKPYHSKSDPEEPVAVKYGDSIQLNCDVLGNPMPDYEWLKNGEIYTFGDKEGSTLTINHVRAEDNGEFVCRASNRAGTAERKLELSVKGAPRTITSIYIILLGIALVLLVAVIVVCCVFNICQKRETARKTEALNHLYEHFLKSQSGTAFEAIPKLPIDQRVYQLPYKNEYELERENLEIGNLLGSGMFGVVYSGMLRKANVNSESSSKMRLPVAVKAPLNGYDVKQQQMLAEELKILCAIGKHPNVVALVGAVTRKMRNGELFVVVELCENGNLLDYLLNNRSNFVNELKTIQTSVDDDYLQPKSATKTQYAAETDPDWESKRLLDDKNTETICTSDLISYAMQIANGMEYLSQVPCVHRDLAARNVLLTSNKVCRIADFGMARRHEDKSYYITRKTRNQKVPARWMSIEAIQFHKYTQESDVWSYGIVLYEIFTLGGKPYPTVSNMELQQYLVAGHRNSKPAYCHEEIYDLMMSCWATNPEKRPSFSNCVYFMKEHIKKASPNLLDRLEQLILQESNKQNELSSWLADEDSGPSILAQTDKPSTSKDSERYLVQEYPMK